MKKILFLCTHNSVRSQMAEGWTNSLFSGDYKSYSAGTEPTSVNPLSAQVMKESGVDITRQKSKSLQQFRNRKFDLVITLCDPAKEACPVFSGSKRVEHHSFPDPSKSGGKDQTAMFRRVRDEIKNYLLNELPSILD